MGVIAHFISIDETKIAVLAANEDALCAYVYPQNPDDPDVDLVDLDKAWHGIGFLLTGKDWDVEAAPPANAIYGGEAFGIDLGMGQPRFFTEGETKEIAEGLDLLTVDLLKKRFDPIKMMEMNIYPNTWDRDAGEELDYLLSNFEILCTFFRQASQRKRAVITWVA
jgi:Domain of unknown function (DUF1877)